MKRLIIIISLVLTMMLLINGSYAASPEEQAKICAQENLPHFLKSVGDAYESFGFSSQEDYAKAYLGKPITTVSLRKIGETLDTMEILKDDNSIQGEKKLKDQAYPCDLHFFPVMVEGKAVTDFVVGLEDGKWEAIQIGGNLSLVIEDMARQNGYAPENSVILYPGFMRPCVLVNKDGQEYVYLPYLDDSHMGLKARELIPSEYFLEGLKKKAEIIKKRQIERSKNPNHQKDILLGGP